jgi:hypothetical protein
MIQIFVPAVFDGNWSWLTVQGICAPRITGNAIKLIRLTIKYFASLTIRRSNRVMKLPLAKFHSELLIEPVTKQELLDQYHRLRDSQHRFSSMTQPYWQIEIDLAHLERAIQEHRPDLTD